MATLVIERTAASTAHMTKMRSQQEKPTLIKWCLSVVRRHPQVIIKGFEKQPKLFLYYIHLFFATTALCIWKKTSCNMLCFLE